MEQQAVRLLIHRVFYSRPKADQRFQTEPSTYAHPEIDNDQVRILRKIDGLSLDLAHCAILSFDSRVTLRHKFGASLNVDKPIRWRPSERRSWFASISMSSSRGR